MGFGKVEKKRKGKPKGEQLELELEDDPKPKKEKVFRESRDNKFKPTTDEELKAIRKRARKAEKVKQKAKGERRTKNGKGPHLGGDRLRAALEQRQHFRVYDSNLFDKFLEFIKANELTKPRYRSYLTEKDADGQFMFEINTCISRMSWVQLTQLLQVAVTSDEKPIGVATRTWSEAHSFVQWCMYIALSVVEKKGMLRLTDRDVLDVWPVEERKRKSKGDKEVKFAGSEDDLDRKNAALKAKGDDDEDEDDEEDEEDEDEDDEDEDDDDEDEDDEDDEDDDGDDEPKSKKGKGKKVKAKPKKSSKDDDDEDEDEDDEDEDEDEDKDDDDDKPKKGKKSKPKSKKSSSKDDDDEDEDEDEDDDKPKKGSAKVSKGKKSAKADKPKKGKKADKSTKADKPAKKVKKSKLDLSDKTVLKKVKPREKGGPKTKVLELVSKKGTSVKKILAAGEEAGMDTKKVKKYLASLHHYGFIEAE